VIYNALNSFGAIHKKVRNFRNFPKVYTIGSSFRQNTMRVGQKCKIMNLDLLKTLLLKEDQV
jgi:hypothetical protein